MKSYIVGNWKMNFSVSESSVYLHKLTQRIRATRDLKVVVAPSFTALQPLSLQVDRKKIRLAAQTASPYDFGPYTGEISCTQLRGLVDYCIVGHSERRQLLNETDKRVRSTVAAALRNQITPILCVGETETERTFGETLDVLRDQVLGGLSEVSTEDISKVIIAYEPIWAMSTTTGDNIASPDEVVEAVEQIRQMIKTSFDKKTSEEISILYGGSVAPANAGAYLTIPGVNGLLVGGASLIADQFIDIIEIAKKVQS